MTTTEKIANVYESHALQANLKFSHAKECYYRVTMPLKLCTPVVHPYSAKGCPTGRTRYIEVNYLDSALVSQSLALVETGPVSYTAKLRVVCAATNYYLSIVKLNTSLWHHVH